MIKMKCSRKRYLFFGVTSSVFLIITVVCVLFLPQWTRKDEEDDIDSYFIKGFSPLKTSSCEGRTCRNIIKRGQQWSDHRYPSCTSEACVLSAARLIKWRDINVDPCEDFYNYSCGNFLRSYTLPEGWNSFGRIDIDIEEVELKIKGILEESVKKNESESLRNAKDVYRSCMSLNSIEEFSFHDLQRVLSRKGIGDWPLHQPEWKDCRLDLEWKMAKLNVFGVDSLFRMETQFQGDDYQARIVVDVAEPLVDDICDEENSNLTVGLEKTAEHREILMSVLELLGVNVTNTTEQDIDEMFEFDFLFCNVTKRSSLHRTPDVSKEDNMTLIELADIAPQINWIRWRNLIFSDLRLDFPYDKQVIYVDEFLAHSIQDISDLLHITPTKVIANYLTWKFIFHHLAFLGNSFRQIFENHQSLMGPKVAPVSMFSLRWLPRWRQCVGYLKKLMPIAVLKDYYNVTHDDDIENAMEDVVIRIKNEFKMVFKNTRDLLEYDRAKSAHKVDKVQIEVSYPNKNDKFFNKYYSGMGKMSDSFLENGMKLSSLHLRKLIEGVSDGKTINDMDYSIQWRLVSPFDLSAYSFFPGDNIIISLAQLQSDIFTYNVPKYKTMSTFGWLIGHELTHGFDLEALDPKSALNWANFSSYVLKDAKRKARCFLQFFPHPHLGENTWYSSLNEDLCDNQGIYLAFKAYLRYLNKNGAEDLLPGLPKVTNEQLFFINYAQQFCEIRREDHPPTSHSAGRRRVNEVLKNFSPFSEAFRCRSAKPMNSPKCEPLWL